MCFTCFSQRGENLPGLILEKAQNQFFLSIPPINLMQNTKKCIKRMCFADKSPHMKVSIMINTSILFSMKAGGCDWCSEAASVGLLPAGRAKSKLRLLRVEGYKSSHLWLEVNIKMYTEDGHQSAQSSVMIRSIIRMRIVSALTFVSHTSYI